MRAQIRSWFRVCGLLGVVFFSLTARAAILQSNDVIVFEFSSLPWTEVSSENHPNPLVSLIYSGTTGDSFRIELFEDNTLQSSFNSNICNSPAPGTYQEFVYENIYPPEFLNPWIDRQGVIRFTGLSGTIVLTNITIQVWDGENIYRQILPIPQPSQGVAAQMSISPAIEISWPTQSTNRYQIQWSSSLNTNDWFDLGSPIQGSGGTNYYLISTRNAELRFYRVVTLTP